MRKVDLTGREHETFTFLYPTTERINKSVAWLAQCKHCGAKQLVGAHQVNRRAHCRCVVCQIAPSQNWRICEEPRRPSE